MNKMIRKQRGVTAIGWMVILALIAFFVLLALRLFPLYNEKMTTITAMNSIASRPDAAKLSNKDVVKYFLRNVQVGGSQRFDDKYAKDHVKVVKPKKKGDPKLLVVNFEVRNEFFQDVKFVLEFNRSVELRGNE
jgi:hypothetical protein